MKPRSMQHYVKLGKKQVSRERLLVISVSLLNVTKKASKLIIGYMNWRLVKWWRSFLKKRNVNDVGYVLVLLYDSLGWLVHSLLLMKHWSLPRQLIYMMLFDYPAWILQYIKKLKSRMVRNSNNHYSNNHHHNNSPWLQLRDHPKIPRTLQSNKWQHRLHNNNKRMYLVYHHHHHPLKAKRVLVLNSSLYLIPRN